jgi:hypothetical protein
MVYIAAITACCIAANQTWAASAWAYETGTGRVGKGVASTITKAKQKARTDCQNNGANPILVEDLSSSSVPGYGAVYTSFNNGLKIGASLGYAKKAKAKKRAKKFCKLSGGTDCQLVDTVHDPGKRAGGKSARRDFAISI